MFAGDFETARENYKRAIEINERQIEWFIKTLLLYLTFLIMIT